MVCQDCGVEAATKHVAFYQNIGALFIRFPKSVEGDLCKTCIHKHFWSTTTITFFLGWWGTISLLVTPFFLLNNLFRYLFCLGMPSVPRDAVSPQLDDAMIRQLMEHVPELFNRLNQGEDFGAVTTGIANQAGVTPGQVALFHQLVSQAVQDKMRDQ